MKTCIAFGLIAVLSLLYSLVPDEAFDPPRVHEVHLDPRTETDVVVFYECNGIVRFEETRLHGSMRDRANKVPKKYYDWSTYGSSERTF